MDIRPRPNLNNQTFRGRIRGLKRSGLHNRSTRNTSVRIMSDVHISSSSNSTKKPIELGRQNSDIKKSLPGNLDPSIILKKQPKRTTTPRPDLPKQNKSNVLMRQVPKPAVFTRPYKHRRPLVPSLLSALAVALFIAGGGLLFNTIRTNGSVKAQVKQLAQQTENNDGISEGLPSESNPPNTADNNKYHVSADLPRLLTIDKINLSARIRRVGVGPNNIMKAPANIFDVGWYDGSAKPGENGTIVLDGHVSGPTKNGVFYDLKMLKAGDKVEIERGDGKKFTYTVTDTQLLEEDKVDMTKVVTTSVPGKPGLNLITCAGRFNVRTNQFEQRLIVYTVQD